MRAPEKRRSLVSVGRSGMVGGGEVEGAELTVTLSPPPSPFPSPTPGACSGDWEGRRSVHPNNGGRGGHRIAERDGGDGGLAERRVGEALTFSLCSLVPSSRTMDPEKTLTFCLGLKAEEVRPCNSLPSLPNSWFVLCSGARAHARCPAVCLCC